MLGFSVDLSVKGVTMIGIAITKTEIKPLKSARSNCHLGHVRKTGNMDCGALSGRLQLQKRQWYILNWARAWKCIEVELH